MALLFMDGFDHSGTTFSIHLTKWLSTPGSPNIVASPVRTGAGALQFLGNPITLTSKVLAASGGFVIGVAVRGTQNFTTAIDVLRVYEGATLHLSVGFDASGHLLVKHGSGTTLGTGTSVLLANTWYYIEFKGVIHDTTGSYALRLDGVAEVTSVAPVDTRNGGATGQWDRIALSGAVSAGQSTYFDDLYVCDQSGSAPHNDFLGTCRVETLLPQTGNGTNVGLTPSTGTDHGAMVDENPPNTSDYNSSPTVGTKDTYNYPSLSLSGAILGIQTNLYVAKSDATARQVCAVVRTSSTDYDGANISPTTSFAYYSEPRALNPATGLAWTDADITALEAGMKVTA